MAEGPDFASLQRQHQSTQSSGDDGVGGNEDFIEPIKKSIEKYLGQVVKAFLGMNLSGLGSTSVLQQFESQGIAAKNIATVFTNKTVGTLYKLFIAPFAKNKEITDNTHGVGGGPEIAASSGGHQHDFGGMTPHTHDFSVSNVSMASLGNLTPSAGGGGGASMGIG